MIAVIGPMPNGEEAPARGIGPAPLDNLLRNFPDLVGDFSDLIDETPKSRPGQLRQAGLFGVETRDLSDPIFP